MAKMQLVAGLKGPPYHLAILPGHRRQNKSQLSWLQLPQGDTAAWTSLNQVHVQALRNLGARKERLQLLKPAPCINRELQDHQEQWPRTAQAQDVKRRNRFVWKSTGEEPVVVTRLFRNHCKVTSKDSDYVYFGWLRFLMRYTCTVGLASHFPHLRPVR